MTEEEWASCTYSVQMIRQRRGVRMSTRKLRLLACACCRRVWKKLRPGDRVAIEVAERHADAAVPDELQAVQPAYIHGGPSASNAVHFTAAPNQVFRSWVQSALLHAAWAVAVRGAKHEAECQAQCRVVRDIFGPNPLRPPAVDPAWQTAVVVAVAQAAYDERILPAGHLDAQRLAVLCDALEEAGCADAQLLGHLRGEGPHWRACWAVDLLLGRS